MTPITRNGFWVTCTKWARRLHEMRPAPCYRRWCFVYYIHLSVGNRIFALTWLIRECLGLTSATNGKVTTLQYPVLHYPLVLQHINLILHFLTMCRFLRFSGKSKKPKSPLGSLWINTYEIHMTACFVYYSAIALKNERQLISMLVVSNEILYAWCKEVSAHFGLNSVFN